MQQTKFVFLAGCFSMLLFGIAVITLGSTTAPLQEKFNLDAIAFGGLFSILPVGILFGSLIFGPFADRYGYKMISVISCFCMFIGFQGIAYSSSLSLLKFCIFLFGLGGGILNGASNAAVADITTTNKGANISLLGVFYAIGALGMPFLLGALEKFFAFEVVVSAVGYLPLLVAVVFLVARFPQPKHAEGIPVAKGVKLLQHDILLLIGFFLFCQSSFEAIINNWTTTYLVERITIPNSMALYALSMYVVGMAVMRLLIGSVLRSMRAATLLAASLALLLVGTFLLQISSLYFLSATGLVLIGAGLAGGFPIMLGFVSNLYADLSATAFSLVLTIALIGNMLVNYLTGIIVQKFGVAHLTSVALALFCAMAVLSFVILRKNKVRSL